MDWTSIISSLAALLLQRTALSAFWAVLIDHLVTQISLKAIWGVNVASSTGSSARLKMLVIIDLTHGLSLTDSCPNPRLIMQFVSFCMLLLSVASYYRTLCDSKMWASTQVELLSRMSMPTSALSRCLFGWWVLLWRLRLWWKLILHCVFGAEQAVAPAFVFKDDCTLLVVCFIVTEFFWIEWHLGLLHWFR